MKINTDKTKFLTKRTFTTTKITKEEFRIKLYAKYEILYDKYKGSELKCTNKSSVIELICEIGDYLQNESYEHFEKLENDFNIVGMGFCMMNYDGYPGQLEFKTLDNGFTYIGIYSSVGDDAVAPIYNIIYFDENGDLRAYCPYCGNLVFFDAGVQMCVYGGYADEEEFTQKLFEEFGKTEPSDSIKYVELFLKLYGEKYGYIGEIDNACFENLEVDTDLMEEDITSNVILI